MGSAPGGRGVLGDPYSDVPIRQQRLLTLAQTTQEAQVTRVADPERH